MEGQNIIFNTNLYLDSHMYKGYGGKDKEQAI